MAVSFEAQAERKGLELVCRLDPELPISVLGDPLRAQEGETRRTPIVAMTASVSNQERERCRAAGIDDFLAKPFRMQGLQRVILRIGPSVAEAEAAVEPDAARVVDVAWLLDSLQDDAQLMGMIAGVYLDKSERYLAEVVAAVSDGHAEALVEAAHRFKSSAGTVAAFRAVDLAARLEALGRAGDLEKARRALPRLIAEQTQVRATLERLRRQSPSPTA